MPTAQEIDTSLALDLRLKHKLTYEQIGKIIGKSKQAIHKQIKPLIPSQITDDYIDNRANILANAQLRLLLALTADKLKKASVNNIAYAFSQFYNAERLERDLSTGNMAVVHQDIASLKGLSSEAVKERE